MLHSVHRVGHHTGQCSRPVCVYATGEHGAGQGAKPLTEWPRVKGSSKSRDARHARTGHAPSMRQSRQPVRQQPRHADPLANGQPHAEAQHLQAAMFSTWQSCVPEAPQWPSTADVHAAACACQCWEDVSALKSDLESRLPQTATPVTAAGSGNSNSTGDAGAQAAQLPPATAVLLLIRLAQLHPAPAMMLGAVPSAAAAAVLPPAAPMQAARTAMPAQASTPDPPHTSGSSRPLQDMQEEGYVSPPATGSSVWDANGAGVTAGDGPHETNGAGPKTQLSGVQPASHTSQPADTSQAACAGWANTAKLWGGGRHYAGPRANQLHPTGQPSSKSSMPSAVGDAMQTGVPGQQGHGVASMQQGGGLHVQDLPPSSDPPHGRLHDGSIMPNDAVPVSQQAAAEQLGWDGSTPWVPPTRDPALDILVCDLAEAAVAGLVEAATAQGSTAAAGAVSSRAVDSPQTANVLPTTNVQRGGVAGKWKAAVRAHLAAGHTSEDVSHTSQAVQGPPAALYTLQPAHAVELASAMAMLGHRHRTHVPQVAAFLGTPKALLSLAASRPQALAAVAWSLAKLGYDPGMKWISYFLAGSRSAVSRFSEVDIAAVMCALGRWGFRPAPAWLDVLWERLRQQGHRLGPHGLANVVWGAAMLRADMPRDVADLLMLEAQVAFPSFNAIGLATVCWGLASLNLRPPGFWVDELLGWALRALHKVPLSARGVPFCNLVWALSLWQAAPPPTWLSSLCDAATPHLPRMSPRSLAVLLLGLADLGAQPSQAWISLALECFHRQHSDADGKTLCGAVWGVSRLMRSRVVDPEAVATWAPPRKWLARYAHILKDIANAVSQRFPDLAGHDLVDVFVGFADLRFNPGREWVASHQAHCDAAVNELTAYQVRLLANASARMSSTWEGDYLPRKGEVL